MAYSQMDYYINMNDGVSPTKESLERLRYIAKISGNQHGCNKQKNKAVTDRNYRYAKSRPTVNQKAEVERLNKICEENEIELIKVFDGETRTTLSRKIEKKRTELISLNISVVNENRIACDECKYFTCNIGRSGNCSVKRKPTKSMWSCGNAERRKKRS